MIFHEHVIHIDESTSKFDVPFHSKAKKPRKKKVFPATNANANANASTSTSNNTESIDSQDEDNNQNPGDDTKKSVNFAKLPAEEDEPVNETLVSPISWIRIDPEMEWLAQFSLAQPDIMKQSRHVLWYLSLLTPLVLLLKGLLMIGKRFGR